MPVERARGDALAVGPEHDDLELDRLAVARLVRIEQGLQADHRLATLDGQHDGALDAAAARLAQSQGDLGFEQPRRLRQRRQLDGDLGLALVVGLERRLELLPLRGKLLVLEAEAESLPSLDTLRALPHEDLAFNGEIGCRRAIEIAALDCDGARFIRCQRRGVGGERHVEPLGHEVLDQDCLLADGRRLGIGIDAHAPGAGHGGRRKGVVVDSATVALIRPLHALRLDAVGPDDDERHRHGARRLGILVAHDGRQVDGFAGLIDAALGEDEGFERARLFAAGDAAIAQVEGGRCQVEERVVGVVADDLGDEESRLQAALALGDACVEAHVATLVGLGACQDLVVAGDEADLDVGPRRRGRERAHEGVDAVLGREGGEPHVGDDEPLRGALAPGASVVVLVVGLGGRLALRLGRAGDEHIDAGLQLGQRLADREGGGHLLVEAARDLQLPRVDALALVGLELVRLVALQLALELVVQDA